MGKVLTRFRTKTAQKPDGAAHTYIAYITIDPLSWFVSVFSLERAKLKKRIIMSFMTSGEGYLRI